MLCIPSRAQLHEVWAVMDTTNPGHGFAVAADGRSAVVGGLVGASRAHATVRDAFGVPLWTAFFDLGPATDEHFSFADFAQDGDLVVLGNVQSPPSTPFSSHGLLARYDPSGNLRWSWTITTSGTSNPSGLERPAALALAANGDIVLAGSAPQAASNDDMTVWRTNSVGVLLWTNSAAGAFGLADAANHVRIAANGDIVVAGAANIVPPAQRDVFVARFSAAGSLLWSREYSNGNGSETATSLALDANGRILVSTPVVDGSSYDGGLLVYDANGTLLWTRTTGLPLAGGDRVEADSHGDIVLLSQTRDAALVDGYDLRKYDADGALLWSTSRAGSRALGFLLEPGDDILVHGWIYSPYPYADALADRYDRHGLLRATTTYGLPGAAGTESIRFALHGPGSSVFGFDSNAFEARVRRFEHASLAVCFGDGLGAACPCANESATIDRECCRNSLGVGGRLDSAGTPNLSNDTLHLDASGVPNSSVLFFQGTAGVAGESGAVFGDGLRCAGGNVLRLATLSATWGATSYPSAPSPSILARGAVTSPGSRWYQAWYRNAANFCTPSTFNLTNALRVDWVL